MTGGVVVLIAVAGAALSWLSLEPHSPETNDEKLERSSLRFLERGGERDRLRR
jgi:hypothetical protein